MKRQNRLALLYLGLGIVGRIIPHPPNTTPFTALCIFSGTHLSRRLALLVTIVAIIIGDAALSLIYRYPLFSYYTLFTYSGFAAITLCSMHLKSNPGISRLAGYGVGATLGFWLWTNLGVWLTSTLYPLTLTGLSTCFIAGLPFLRNSVIGNLVWLTVMVIIYKKVPSKEYVNVRSN